MITAKVLCTSTDHTAGLPTTLIKHQKIQFSTDWARLNNTGCCSDEVSLCTGWIIVRHLDMCFDMRMDRQVGNYNLNAA